MNGDMEVPPAVRAWLERFVHLAVEGEYETAMRTCDDRRGLDGPGLGALLTAYPDTVVDLSDEEWSAACVIGEDLSWVHVDLPLRMVGKGMSDLILQVEFWDVTSTSQGRTSFRDLHVT